MKMNKETKEQEKRRLIYHSEYRGDVEVELNILQYLNNGNIYIGLYSQSEGNKEPYADVTVNLGDRVPTYCGYLDTNNLSNVEKFISENNLGSFTGFVKSSGYCQYPLYMFNVNKLRELCPKQMENYERKIYKFQKEPQRETCR